MSILNEIGAVLINGVIGQVHADVILVEETQVCGVRARAGLPLPVHAFPRPLRLKEVEKKGEVSGLPETGKTGSKRGTLQYEKVQFLRGWEVPCLRDTAGCGTAALALQSGRLGLDCKRPSLIAKDQVWDLTESQTDFSLVL